MAHRRGRKKWPAPVKICHTVQEISEIPMYHMESSLPDSVSVLLETTVEKRWILHFSLVYSLDS